jgi:transcriptional regulator with XRE-family HTH domain
MDQVVGTNLIRLRAEQGLNLRDYADRLGQLTGDSFTAAKLSRWETGQYGFTLNDLYILALIYSVDLGTLMKPDRDVTHILVGNVAVPVVQFRHDFLLGPATSFTDRATAYAQAANPEDTAIIVALTEAGERLGYRAGLGDVKVELKAVEVKAHFPAVTVTVTSDDDDEEST